MGDGDHGDSASLPGALQERQRGSYIFRSRSSREDLRDDGDISAEVARTHSDNDEDEPITERKRSRSRSHNTSDGRSPILQGNYMADNSARSSDSMEFSGSNRDPRDLALLETAETSNRSRNSSSNFHRSSAESAESSGAGAGESLAAMARMGKLSTTRDFIDIEIIGPDEKALIAVGELWDWTCSRRLLQNVTEATLYNMPLQSILLKFSSAQLSALPALKTLRLFRNDIQSLKQVEFLPRMWGSLLEHLVLRENPVCSVAAGQMVRAFLIAAMPKLQTFNEENISSEEREKAHALYGQLLQMQTAARTNEAKFTAGGSAKMLKPLQQPSPAAAQQAHQQRRRVYMGARSIDGEADIGSDSADIMMDALEGSAAMVDAAVVGSASQSMAASGLLQGVVLQRKQYKDFSACFESVVKSLVVEAVEGAKPKRK